MFILSKILHYFTKDIILEENTPSEMIITKGRIEKWIKGKLRIK